MSERRISIKKIDHKRLHAAAAQQLGDGVPVLSADAARAMASDQLSAAQKAHGGLGPDFFKGRSWGYGQAVHDSGAFGWDGDFGSPWLVDPANDLTVIVLTQRMFETPEPPQVHRDIQAAAYAALA
jgi:CubicO group peptidase (beta-lactamase class C family)